MVDVGDTVGHYEIRDRLTAGASAHMFKAADLADGHDVALKVWILSDEIIRRRAGRELGVLRTLQHPNIVRVVDVIETPALVAAASEWQRSGSLEDRLGTDDTLTLVDTLRLGADVASALEYAHGLDVLHRDLKPSNVLIDQSGSFLLTDFGAFGRLDKRTHATAAGEISGTPVWMAPEQLVGDRQTTATDLYGLGLLIFRSYHGHLPGGIDSYLDLARTRAAQITVPASPLQGLLRRLLDPVPALRPQRATEVRNELASLLGRIQATPTDGFAVPADQEAHPTPLPPTHSTATQPAPRLPPPIESMSLPPAPPQPRPAPLTETESSPLAASLAPKSTRALMVLGVVVGAGLVVLLSRTTGGSTGDILLRAALGVAIAALALFVALRLRRAESHPASEQATAILYGIEGQQDLGETLMKTVDEIVAELRTLDAKLLGVTLLAMANEYEDGEKSSDRQTALLNVATLMEKLNRQLSPWYIRYKEQLAVGVTLVGALAGLLTAVSGFVP